MQVGVGPILDDAIVGRTRCAGEFYSECIEGCAVRCESGGPFIEFGSDGVDACFRFDLFDGWQSRERRQRRKAGGTLGRTVSIRAGNHAGDLLTFSSSQRTAEVLKLWLVPTATTAEPTATADAAQTLPCERDPTRRRELTSAVRELGGSDRRALGVECIHLIAGSIRRVLSRCAGGERAAETQHALINF